jgi:hypothetical protein
LPCPHLPEVEGLLLYFAHGLGLVEIQGFGFLIAHDTHPRWS